MMDALFEYQIFNFSIQGLLFIPVILLVLLMIQYRNKLIALDNTFTYLDNKFSKRSEKALLYLAVLVITFIISYFICLITFPYSDIEDAMQGAIKAFFFNGKNPYVSKVVPHIFISGNNSYEQNGTYNYGPIDLLVYGFGYLLFHPIVGNSWWLMVTNFILVIFIYFIIRNIIPIPETIKFIPFMLLSSLFMQDNIILMAVFLAIAWYIHVKVETDYKYPLITVVLTLGSFTKMYLVFVLVAYFFYVFKNDIHLWITNGIISLVTSVIVIFPFGIINVIDSIIIFQINLDMRKIYATLQGGLPLYLDMLHLDWIYTPLAFILTLVFLIVSEKYAKNQLELKISTFLILNLILLPSSAYAFFYLPGLLMLLQYYTNHLNMQANINQLVTNLNSQK